MSIRIACPNCEQVLEVPDTTVGRDALCPQCETVFRVTDPAQSESRPVGSEVPATADDVNPFAAPQTGDPTDRMDGQGTPSADSIPVEPGAIITAAFELWKQHWWVLVAMTTVVWIINMALSQTADWLVDYGWAMAEVPRQFQGWYPLISQAAIGIAGLPVLYLQTGVTKVILKLLRGQPATFGEMFLGCGHFGSLLVGLFPFGLGLILGTVFCVVPGVFVWLVYWPCYFLAVDGRSNVMKRALQLTKGHLLTGLQLVLIATGLYVVGVLACCVGIVVPASLVSVMWATAYVAVLEQSNDEAGEPST
ncbi:MAG: hypothetical protein VX346_19205 [Planctomycetota bacterium]|nr:hypothetical protein [Planctomycetota bacterium]